MADQTKVQECIAPGVRHSLELVIAAFGYQCFGCTLCDYFEDVVEDSQP